MVFEGKITEKSILLVQFENCRKFILGLGCCIAIKLYCIDKIKVELTVINFELFPVDV